MSSIFTLLRCKTPKHFFCTFLNQNSAEPTGKRRWSEIFELSDKELRMIFRLPLKVTHDGKLQWFQYRILNKIVASNSYFFKIKDDKNCTFCRIEE